MTWYSKGARLFVLVLSLSLVILSGPVFAQANEEKAELAEKIISLHREEGYLERALQAAIQNVPTGQKAAMEEAISRLDQDAIYAGWTEKVDETYTIEEMKAYLDYAATDVGRSTLRKSTEINAKIYEVLVFELLAAMQKE